MAGQLSSREREILTLIAAGKTSKEIAVALQVSAATIASHRKNICRKLGIHSTAALIQYAVEECIASGIEHVIFVTGRRKNAIEDHFDFAPELESFLESKGKAQQAQMVREISGGLHFSYTRQSDALGLGHAVLTARELVGDEPFAVLLGDVIMDGPVPATRSLIEIYNETGKGAITVQEVDFSNDATAGSGGHWAKFQLSSPVTVDLVAQNGGNLADITGSLRVEPGKRWQQRWVYVEDAVGKCSDELRRHQPHVAGETD